MNEPRDKAKVAASEFAAVSVEFKDQGNGPRLKITDLETEGAVYLDALELSCLTSITHQDFDRIVIGHERYKDSLKELQAALLDGDSEN